MMYLSRCAGEIGREHSTERIHPPRQNETGTVLFGLDIGERQILACQPILAQCSQNSYTNSGICCHAAWLTDHF